MRGASALAYSVAAPMRESSMPQPCPSLRQIAVLFAATCMMSHANAQLIPGYPDDVRAHDAREVALLPPYCMFTQLFRDNVPGGRDRVKAARWESVIGPDHNHLHHYCWGLMKVNRARLLAQSEETRKFYFSDAVREFDYSIDRSSRGFVLLPEMLARKGEALLRIGQVPSALEALERAIELKPDYWPPYAFASDYFREAGNAARAREWLDRGVAAIPESQELKSRLASLDASPGARGVVKR